MRSKFDIHIKYIGSIFLLLTATLSLPTHARELKGVELAEQATLSSGQTLVLNGAGVRKKLFFSIYVAGLYLPETSSDVAAILDPALAKQLTMQFVYDEVSRDKIIAAWNEGFTANTNAESLASLETEIDRFNGVFDTMHEGDSIVLTYQPGDGVAVIIKDQIKTTIAGDDFQAALFSIWLGQAPVTESLKADLLGN